MCPTPYVSAAAITAPRLSPQSRLTLEWLVPDSICSLPLPSNLPSHALVQPRLEFLFICLFPFASQVLELLVDSLRQWSCSISFPELAHLPLMALKGFVKTCSVERFKRSAKLVVAALDKNTTWVGSARDNVSFSPQDAAAVAAFLADEAADNKVRNISLDCLIAHKVGSGFLDCWQERGAVGFRRGWREYDEGGRGMCARMGAERRTGR